MPESEEFQALVLHLGAESRTALPILGGTRQLSWHTAHHSASPRAGPPSTAV
jgi:hypothetical protein